MGQTRERSGAGGGTWAGRRTCEGATHGSRHARDQPCCAHPTPQMHCWHEDVSSALTYCPISLLQTPQRSDLRTVRVFAAHACTHSAAFWL